MKILTWIAVVFAALVIIVVAGYYIWQSYVNYSTVPVLEMPLQAVDGSGNIGTATFFEASGSKSSIKITLEIQKETSHPVSIHSGSCVSVGEIKYPLRPIINGESDTILDIPLKQLLTDLPIAVNVLRSAEDSATISCGAVSN